MEFEVKKTEVVGSVSVKDEQTSIQHINITVGVVGCPYDDISSVRTVAYEFSNSLTITEAREGIRSFAEEWTRQNYPNT